MDSGKPISSRVQRHISACDACRKYAELCTSLKPKFSQDKRTLMEGFDPGIHKKIFASLPENPGWEREPGHPASTSRRLVRTPALIPSFAAAFAVLILSLSILLILPRSKQPPPMGKISTLISSASPEDVLSKVESPLEKEYTELKRTLESTSKFLVSSLDFRIGPQAK
jgi:hypothetical protein